MFDGDFFGTVQKFFPLISKRRGDKNKRAGPYPYIRRHQPQPGQSADVFDWVQLLPQSPIGPSYLNRRQLMTAPATLGMRTIGIQSPGVVANSGELVGQPLLVEQDTTPLTSQFVNS